METSNKSSSQLYKAQQRLYEANKSKETYSIFDKNDPANKGFGKLRFFDDVFVAAGRGIINRRTEGTQQILLPLKGTFSYNDILHADKQVPCEEVLYLSNTDGSHFIQNNYEREMINYLHIGLQNKPLGSETLNSQSIRLKAHNELTTIGVPKQEPQHHLSFGVYKKGAEGSYKVNGLDQGLFLFAIQGSFEADERPMESRDALALWNKNEIRFRSLSEHATLLIIELPLN